MRNIYFEIEKKIGYKTNYDVIKKKIDDSKYIYYLSSLVDSYLINELLKGFMINKNVYLNGSIIKSDNINEIVNQILSGCVLLIDNGLCYIIETRSYPTRSISESESEKSLKGSHDSFNESIIINTGLIRRRIKDENFKCELFQVGKNNKTDISINYISSLANKNILYKIKRKIKEINIDSLMLADKALTELLFKQKFSIFPKVRYTERSDIASIHIQKGYIVLLIDTSSVAVIIPTSFFELNEQLEEYQLPPVISTFNRLFRFFCLIIAMFIVPLWFIQCLESNEVNNTFFIVKNIEKNKLFIQIISVEIFLNIIRLASYNSTSMLSTSMSLLATIILSSLAIEIGLVLPEVVFYCALSSICCFSISNYETSRAISFCSLIFVLSIGLFGKIGFILANTIMFINLVNINTFDTYYLYPFIPFNFKELIKKIIKFPNKK